ncbi:type II toxin-antitoxin system PemK/MazF family toxin [Candidatus Peregrinibacteria bacterium]|nr:MAG: type II toxin-antitoxin system PemK/MazF family toxin [Candidatus Peregrinibacteria bacterium]
MTIKLQQGDLVLVPFPFSDLSAVKSRPALVVSNKTLKGEDCILVAVTSQSSKKNQIKLNDHDMAQGSLPVQSYIRPSKIISLKKSIIRRVFGKLKKKKLKEVEVALFGYLKMK